MKPGRPLGADPLLQSFWSAAVEQNPHLSATRFPPLSKVSSNYKYFFSELKHGHRAQHTSAKHPENGAPRRGTDFYWRFFHIFTANKQIITLAFLDNLNSAFYISSWFTVAQVSWNPTALNTSAAQHIKVLSVACFCVFDIQPKLHPFQSVFHVCALTADNELDSLSLQHWDCKKYTSHSLSHWYIKYLKRWTA